MLQTLTHHPFLPLHIQQFNHHHLLQQRVKRAMRVHDRDSTSFNNFQEDCADYNFTLQIDLIPMMKCE